MLYQFLYRDLVQLPDGENSQDRLGPVPCASFLAAKKPARLCCLNKQDVPALTHKA